MNSTQRFLGRLACLFALPLAGRAGFAAEVDAQAMPDLVITATREPRSAFDLPAAVTPVRMGVDAAAAINPSEFLRAVPGVLARDRQNYAQDEQISIRGFGARSSFGVRGVRLYMDGIPATQPDGQGQTSHFDLAAGERIEVLRGPFSALYGNASGGVIQLFTADGEPPASGGFAGGGSYGQARADVFTRGVAGAFDYSLDANYFRTDGFRAHGAAQRWLGNAKLKIALPKGTLRLLANSFDAPEAQDPQGLARAQYEADPRQAAPSALQFNTRKSARQYQGGAIYELSLSESQSLRALAYFGSRDVNQYLSVPVAAQSSPTNSGGVIDLSSRYGGADLRWTGRWSALDAPLELSAGLSYDRQNQRRLGYENFSGAQLGVRGRLRRDEEDDVYNLDEYAQAEWRVAPAWWLSAGLRYSLVRFFSDDRYLAAGNPDDSGDKSYRAATPVAGVLYRPNERWRVYASFGRGFETPTFNELAYRPDGSAGLNLDLQAARSNQSELGARYRSGHGASIDAALFQADTRDEIAVAASQGGRTSFRNAGGARRRGFELGLTQPLVQAWSLVAAYTFLDARFDGGARIPGVPRSAGDLELRWLGASSLHGTLFAQAFSAVNADDAGSAQGAGYALLGAELGYRCVRTAPKLELFLRLDNLLDRRYVGSVIVNEANGRYFEPGPGRSAFAGLKLVL